LQKKKKEHYGTAPVVDGHSGVSEEESSEDESAVPDVYRSKPTYTGAKRGRKKKVTLTKNKMHLQSF